MCFNLMWLVEKTKQPCSILDEKFKPGNYLICKSDLVAEFGISLVGGAPDLFAGFFVLHPHLAPGPIDGDAVVFRLFDQPKVDQKTKNWNIWTSVKKGHVFIVMHFETICKDKHADLFNWETL